ncbi:MAG: ribonuclease [Ruminococcaceae bacterium]|nr:ribonuclease [Oscillospiraceae bacterium]
MFSFKHGKKLSLLLTALILLSFVLGGCSEALELIEAIEQIGTFESYEPTDPNSPLLQTEPIPFSSETAPQASETERSPHAESTLPALEENGSYTAKEDVSLYLHTYGKLPQNFITKGEARDLGWEGGSLEPYAKGFCIGGDTFGNYEGLLPKKSGRTYRECDIDTLGKSSRGAKRIVYSNDGLIYYTDDHYESFTLLYGDA